MGCNHSVLRYISCGPVNMISAGSADKVMKIPVMLPDVLLMITQVYHVL